MLYAVTTQYDAGAKAPEISLIYFLDLSRSLPLILYQVVHECLVLSIINITQHLHLLNSSIWCLGSFRYPSWSLWSRHDLELFPIMANAYKNLKEQFVSNHSGGSILEINLVTAIAPVCNPNLIIKLNAVLILSQAAYLLWAALQSKQSFFQTKSPIVSLIDFSVNVGGLLLALTIYSSMPGVLLALFLVPALLILVLPSSKASTARHRYPVKSEDKTQELSNYPRRPFITVYRGCMMVVTSIAILAVDFRVFPRRFAKVETWGTSLMDVGVGSFVFAAGLASSKAFTSGTSPTLREDKELKGVMSRAIQSVRQSLPLLILGGARLISLKNLDYAEHVSEYGVHWNFFFTLAAIPLALLVLQPLIIAIPGLSHGYFGIILVALYEVLLQTTSLKAWILTAPRKDLISQNKEGIFSCIGYLAIFLLGLETGSITLPRAIPKNSILFKILKTTGLQTKSESNRIFLLTSLAILTATYSSLLVPFYSPRIFPWLSIPVSRRLANVPYVLWIGAYNTGQLLIFALIESFVFPAVHRASSAASERQAAITATPEILDDYNSGGLLVFLFANLGTGLVNLSIDTLEVGQFQTLGILMVYMAILTILARLSRGVKIRL